MRIATAFDLPGPVGELLFVIAAVDKPIGDLSGCLSQQCGARRMFGVHQENVHRFGRPVGGKELHDLAAESSDTFFDVFTGQRIVVHDGHPFPLQRLVKECPRAVFEHGQIGPKHGALTFDTLDQEPASHDAKQFAHNGKPQSVAAAAILRASLAKRLGDGIEFVAGDADSRVLDGQPHSESVAVLVESA